ncbi:MAG: hypothetical protein Kapaf2KO_18140 [Candidatus Kapaibacteriales bacterium]
MSVDRGNFQRGGGRKDGISTYGEDYELRKLMQKEMLSQMQHNVESGSDRLIKQIKKVIQKDEKKGFKSD